MKGVFFAARDELIDDPKKAVQTSVAITAEWQNFMLAPTVPQEETIRVMIQTFHLKGIPEISPSIGVQREGANDLNRIN
jgi:hypothetical protein